MSDESSSALKTIKPDINPALERAAAHAWRIIVIGVVCLAALWLLRQARVVFFPIVIAAFLTRALSPVSGWLRRHRWRPGLAAVASIIGFFVLLAGVLALTVPSFADEIDSVGPTLTSAIDDVENWFADDSPIPISHASFDRLRERVADEVDELRRSSDGDLTDRATLMAEVVTGALLAVILTFFMLRDGARFSAWLCSRARAERQPRLRRALDSAWTALAGYLRGATLLGVVESAIIGITLFIAGGSLIAPVMLITFLGAFIPIVGAVVTGAVAVLVALVTGGTGATIAVAVVALLVQQFDNDLLSPIIYGRTLSLHPVVILLSVVAGGALFGIVGTALAVPVVAVSVNGVKAYRAARLDITGASLVPQGP